MKQVKIKCSQCEHTFAANILVPLPLVTGRYEELTRRELKDHIKDLLAECQRRGMDTSWALSQISPS